MVHTKVKPFQLIARYQWPMEKYGAINPHDEELEAYIAQHIRVVTSRMRHLWVNSLFEAARCKKNGIVSINAHMQRGQLPTSYVILVTY